MSQDTWQHADRKETRIGQEHPQDERSLGELLNSAAHDIGQLMRQELELAKVELREEAGKASKAGAKMGAGAVIGHLALLLASFAAAWGLAEVMHPAWAFLIVAVVYGIVAAVLFAAGRKQFREMSTVPRQTVETLKEDASWAREQVK
jgi:hypothetical protein